MIESESASEMESVMMNETWNCESDEGRQKNFDWGKESERIDSARTRLDQGLGRTAMTST